MVLISVACVIIILAGLKAASSVVVPFLLAIFIAATVSPLVLYIQKFGIPRLIAFCVVTAFFVGILIFFGDIVFNAVKGFTAQLPELQSKFSEFNEALINKINSYGIIELDGNSVGFDINLIINQTTAVLKKTGTLLSMGFFVFIMVAFMVFESKEIKEKIEYFSSKNEQAGIFAENFTTNLKKYLLIKTIASVATGLLIGLLLWVLGVPYAALWGICAFILNYIPTIGSIMAAIPTLFVTLSTMSVGVSVWVVGIYLFVNVLIGNIIEPRFMGKGLGLSVVVVLVSLLLWGFVFGIGGMFLAIPLTMSLQIALNSNPKTKFLAVLLSNKINNENSVEVVNSANLANSQEKRA